MALFMETNNNEEQQGFVCGRALGGHMRSHGTDSEEEGALVSGCASDEDDRLRWSKGKRSRRTAAVSEEEDLAYCLLMLSATSSAAAKTEESCASPVIGPMDWPGVVGRAGPTRGGAFECKACKKVFGSHQALGGHRASHKKVKGCFAARVVPDDDARARAERPAKGACEARKAKAHECSICHRVFASGQALGGHKRCHWITTNSVVVAREVGPLDLNLPAQAEEAFDAVFVRPWIGLRTSEENNNVEFDNNNDGLNYNSNDNIDDNVNYLGGDGDDEVESKGRMRRLSELKELRLGGGGGGGGDASWLQVGIGSSGNGSSGP
ncbi:Zinc finger protein ZAT3 [Acorus gramineus]|uniref:Zinc finger protein ZAT3 n=1 Tax=Acorus gramineus TaxID=55184 RepID=A0AAV9B702_ACOGR|nr:Zinc finger protein ZAT3 [Acorus gramineus]